VLGREHVQRKRELAKRERARDRAATTASAVRAKTRTKPRDAAHQARYNDIYAALRGLGSTDAEARRGAGMAEAMPGASLEECVRAALIELAHPVAMRGERRARCTA